MALPARSFYSIHEIAIRWDVMPTDIIGWAIDGHFDLATALPPIQAAGRTIAGLVTIAAADVFAMFRRDGSGPGAVAIRRIRENQDDDWAWISEPAEGVMITPWDVLLTRKAVDRFEAKNELFAANAAPAAARRGGPGRPSQHDWDGFYVALCKRIHDQGLPQTQAELIRAMQDWFDTRAGGPDGGPDESTIRRKVQNVWRELRG